MRTHIGVALLFASIGAAHAKVSVAVLPIPGPHGAAARKALLGAIRGGGVTEVDPRLVDRALGTTRPEQVSGPSLLVLASSIGADIVVVGTCVKSPRGISARLLLGATGETLEQIFLPVRDTKYRGLDARVGAKLRASLAKGRAPDEPKPSPVPPPPPGPAPKDEPRAEAPPPMPAPQATSQVQVAPSAAPAEVRAAPQPTGRPIRGLPTVDAMIGAGVLHRQLGYTDDLFQALASYSLPAGLSVQAEAQFFPIPNIGLEARYKREPGLASQDASGNRLSTLSDSWDLAGVFRYPLGSVETTGHLGVGGQRFAIQPSPGTTTSGVPGVSYIAARIGAGARVSVVRPISVLVGLDYLPVLHTGQISSTNYFPRLGVGALHARAGVAVSILDPFEARVVLDYQRYFYSMNPQPGDPLIAGGALDEYLTVTAGVGVRW